MTINVIYGPPGAGKTTYLQEHAQPGDITIDLDTIAEALGSPDTHAHPKHIKDIAGAARAIAIHKAIERGHDTWVIDTNLKTKALTETPCIYHLVDPGQTITLQRAQAAGRPKASIDAIHRWYANPPQPPAQARQATPRDDANLGETVTDWW